MVARPYKDSFNAEEYASLFESAILQYFCNTKYVVVDNSKDLSNNLTKQYLNTLNILLVNTCPYSHKSNKAEILQKHLLTALRINTQQALIDPKNWHMLLTQSLISLNNTTFQRLKYAVSPYNLMFSRYPDNQFTALNPSLLQEEGYSSYVVETAKASFLNGLLITAMQKERIREAEKSGKSTDNRISAGDIVYKRSDILNLTGVSKKLRPRFKSLYFVLATSRTSAFIKLYTQSKQEKEDYITFQKFLENPKDSSGKTLKSFHFEKVDIGKLQKVKGIVICNPATKDLYEDSKVDYPDLPIEIEVEPGQSQFLISKLNEQQENQDQEYMGAINQERHVSFNTRVEFDDKSYTRIK